LKIVPDAFEFALRIVGGEPQDRPEVYNKVSLTTCKLFTGMSKRKNGFSLFPGFVRWREGSHVG
jgi:hypothetical protein